MIAASATANVRVPPRNNGVLRAGPHARGKVA
jgi:hypothetical protein